VKKGQGGTGANQYAKKSKGAKTAPLHSENTAEAVAKEVDKGKAPVERFGDRTPVRGDSAIRNRSSPATVIR
jgi:hypothetical protein